MWPTTKVGIRVGIEEGVRPVESLVCDRLGRGGGDRWTAVTKGSPGRIPEHGRRRSRVPISESERCTLCQLIRQDFP